MKKNFFKKLSFVLALAMVIATITPAAGAFAKSAPKLNSTKQYLYLDVDGNEFNFNISNKSTGWSYEWFSSKDVVATVEKNGVVTAEGAGTTVITCEITDKDGEIVKTLNATVVVRDNIKTVTITNTPVDNKLAVGVENDFNRSYVTEAGKKTGSQSVTRWFVTKDAAATTDATIADNGLFVAKVAGKYTITAVSFQSAAKYTAWLADKTANAKYVLDDCIYDVEVVASMEKAVQVNKNSLNVTFTSPIVKADVVKNITVSSLVANTTAKVKLAVKEVVMDATNKIATVTMYSDFVAETTYVVDYTAMDAVSFKAATKNIADVVDMQVVTTTATIGVAKAIEVKLFNKDGVDITTADLLNKVTLTSTSEKSYWNNALKELTLFTVNDTTTINAVFHTFTYDQATGKEIGTIERASVVTCIPVVTVTVGAVAAYTIENDATPDYVTVSHTLATGDSNYKMYVKSAKSNGTDFVTSDADAKFTFASSDINTLIVASNGLLFPVKAGVATVIVSYNNVVLDAITITINPARVASTLNLTSSVMTLTNDTNVNEVKTTTVEVLDQYGKVVTLANTSFEKMLGAVDGLVAGPAAGVFTVSAKDIAAGSYTYTIKSNGLVRYLTVNVQAPTDQVSTSYRLNLSAVAFDTKLTSTDLSEVLTVKVYGYAANGIANDLRTVSGTAVTPAGFTVDVTNPDGATVLLNANGELTLANTVSGAAVYKAAVGTYKVKLTNTATNQVCDIQFFEVKNTQTAPVVVTDKLVSTATTLLVAVEDCFSLTLNGTAVNIYAVGVTAGEGKSIFIKDVIYREAVGTSYIEHTVAVNTTITFAPVN